MTRGRVLPTFRRLAEACNYDRPSRVPSMARARIARERQRTLRMLKRLACRWYLCCWRHREGVDAKRWGRLTGLFGVGWSPSLEVQFGDTLSSRVVRGRDRINRWTDKCCSWFSQSSSRLFFSSVIGHSFHHASSIRCFIACILENTLYLHTSLKYLIVDNV